jgi:beta-fructofuranosidase
MPDSRYYEEQTEVNDTSIHAWRDPFLFTLENSIYMLVSAKSRFSPLGKKGAIALLKARENSLIDWDILPPLYAPSVYSEMEVPQIYNERGSLLLCFSSLQKGDFNSKTNFEGGFHSIYLNELISTQENINTNVILPASSNVYACRIIPELGGCVVGFDLSRGGFVKTDCMVQASQLNRDFTMYSRANLGQ